MQAPEITKETLSHVARVWDYVPKEWPNQEQILHTCQGVVPMVAAALVIFGVIYLLFGYYLFRALVVLNFALLAAFFGALAGEKLGSVEGGMLVVGLIGAAAAFALIRHAVALFGAIIGALAGATLWRTAGLDHSYAWSGAIIGMILFFFLTFLLFRGCIILFTCLQGSAMVVVGVLALVYKYPNVSSDVTSYLTNRPLILPLSVFIPTILGLMFQLSYFPSPPPAKK